MIIEVRRAHVADNSYTDSRFHWPDVPLMVLTLALPLVGLLAIYSASIAIAYAETGDPSYYFRRQVVFLMAGLAVTLVVARTDYHWLDRIQVFGVSLTSLLFVAVLTVLGAMYFSHLGHTARGSERWLQVGSFTLQPSEFAKPALAIFLAQVLSSRIRSMRNPFTLLVPLGALASVAGIVALQPDLGTALVIGIVGVGILVAAQTPVPYLLGLGGLGGTAVWVAIVTQPYRLQRLTAYLSPLDPQYRDNVGFHTYQALLALGSGGVGGVGLGEGLQKYFYLPEPHTDTIFAVVGEELGLIGTSLVLLLYLFLAWRGYTIAYHAPDVFGRLLAAGLTTGLFGQALLNMAVVTGLVPFTGVPLPFISSGGSSLLASLISMGLLLNISSQSAKDSVSTKVKPTWWHRFGWGHQGGQVSVRPGRRRNK